MMRKEQSNNKINLLTGQAKLYLLLIAIIVLGLNNVFGCSCHGESTVQNEIKGSTLVVVGTVISKDLILLTDSTQIKLFPNDTAKHKLFPFTRTIAKYKIVVEQLYKGNISSDTLTIYTGVGGGDCGNKFTIGDKFIIYGFDKTYFGLTNNDFPYPEGKNIYWTNICSRTINFHQEELDEIKKYEKQKEIKTD